MAGRRRLEAGAEAGPSLCEVGGSGTVVLPVFGDAEHRWPAGLRIVLYLLGLAWCFMGVALISDVFMGAIEQITSKKVRKYSPARGRWYTTHVWNPTVANLTLMALGSSAPEILLSVVETVLSNQFFSGDLGPSTIVGSAAFNLFVIIAVCVMSIPDGEVRRIKELPVYCVTAVFSIFAYVWLLFVLLASSPNVVEVWEGVVTFLFFPLLVLIAWLADKGYFSGGVRPAMGNGTVVSVDMSKEELAELDVQIRKEYGSHVTDEMVQKIIALRNSETRTRLHYRVATTRAMSGGKRLKGLNGPTGRITITDILLRSAKRVVPMETIEDDEEVEKCFLEFATASYAVIENAGSVKLKVSRRGCLDAEAVVKYRTRDGTAKGQVSVEDPRHGRNPSPTCPDYVSAAGVLIFGPGEVERIIDIKILDDNTYEEDEEFFVDLFDPIVCSDTTDKSVQVKLVDNLTGKEVRTATAKVTIIDDDSAGTVLWAREEITIEEQSEDTEAIFEVHRKCGSKGKIVCKYETENGSALAGTDYERVEGEIEFDDGICIAKVKVKVLARGRYGTSESFRVVLKDISGHGAKFDPATDGGEDSCILTVHIEADKKAMERVDAMMSTMKVKWEKAKLGHSSWKEQFLEAVQVNGGDDGEDDPSWVDYCMHALLLPWKLVFACCPPADYCGGWICFAVSLLMIGGVTCLIGDMANLFGCVLPFMENEITAITFVALGTSLPDTFASRTAAMQDPYADASVGNVTGSNSVNVFLGLGLPWLLASFYWAGTSSHSEWTLRYQNDPELTWLGPPGSRDFAYVVKAGSLAFSVAVFACCAVLCIAVLALRRRCFGGELGGPKVPKRITSVFLVCLWLFYILMSVLNVKGVL